MRQAEKEIVHEEEEGEASCKQSCEADFSRTLLAGQFDIDQLSASGDAGLEVGGDGGTNLDTLLTNDLRSINVRTETSDKCQGLGLGALPQSQDRFSGGNSSVNTQYAVGYHHSHRPGPKAEPQNETQRLSSRSYLDVEVSVCAREDH